MKNNVYLKIIKIFKIDRTGETCCAQISIQMYQLINTQVNVHTCISQIRYVLLFIGQMLIFIIGMMRCSLSFLYVSPEPYLYGYNAQHSHIHLGSLYYCAFVKYSIIKREIYKHRGQYILSLLQIKSRYTDAGSSARFYRSKRRANLL